MLCTNCGADVPNSAPAPAQPAPVQAQKRKSNKTALIVVGAIVLIALLVAGGFVGFSVYRSSTYEKAMAMLQSGDYQGAYDTFGKLGDYEDSADQLRLAKQWLDYREARILFDTRDFEGALLTFQELGDFENSGDYVKACEMNLDYLQALSDFENSLYDEALVIFIRLTDEGFQDAKTWISKTKYTIADEKYQGGDLYGAYKGFKELGSYEDSEGRKEACTTAFPDTGVIYKDSDYGSTRSQITIDSSKSPSSSYFKIYHDTTLVAVLWINGGEKLTIDAPPADYSIKQATGDPWFGEEILFGDEGYYEVILFDGDKEYFTLSDNTIATISLSVSGANTGSKETDRTTF